MTRWKREQTTTLILSHAHNQWSRWNDAILAAADSLGLPVARRVFRNPNDGSRDCEWYTITSALDAAGGYDEVVELANATFN